MAEIMLLIDSDGTKPKEEMLELPGFVLTISPPEGTLAEYKAELYHFAFTSPRASVDVVEYAGRFTGKLGFKALKIWYSERLSTDFQDTDLDQPYH